MSGTDSRDVVLGRVRRALADVPRQESPRDAPVVRDYLRTHSPADPAAMLAGRIADYRAAVHRTGGAGLRALVAGLLDARGSRTVVVPDGLPEEWLAGTEIRRVADTPDLTPNDLDGVDSVVTGCALAIAETGTIVLDGGPGQGRRRITLVPDHHVCVVRVPDEVVDSVPQALERLDPSRPLTWISGPSATSDIELDRVEGVHGPRALDVVLLTGR